MRTLNTIIALLLLFACKHTVHSAPKKSNHQTEILKKQAVDPKCPTCTTTSTTTTMMNNPHANTLADFTSKSAWQVAINIWQGGEYKFRCGGSLISPTVVLTAAHCVHSSDINAETMRVVAGEVDRNLDEGTEQYMSVDRIITHPNYTGTLTSLYSHDIALLRLTSPVTISDTVHPVPNLASAPSSSSLTCFMTGWGMSREQVSANELSPTLTLADIGLLSLSECNKRKNWDGLVEARQLCGYNKKMAACLGDSGGPLVCDVNNTLVQYGVTSWGSKSCDRKPSVFTKVSFYIDWINGETI